MVDAIAGKGLAAIQSGLKRAEVEAGKLSKAFSPEGDGGEPVESIIGLSEAKREVAAGAKIIKVAQELSDSVLDIVG